MWEGGEDIWWEGGLEGGREGIGVANGSERREREDGQAGRHSGRLKGRNGAETARLAGTGRHWHCKTGRQAGRQAGRQV